jgi:hypothetical protein
LSFYGMCACCLSEVRFWFSATPPAEAKTHTHTHTHTQHTHLRFAMHPQIFTSRECEDRFRWFFHVLITRSVCVHVDFWVGGGESRISFFRSYFPQ